MRSVLQYNFNKPCCGKDQYVRESAAAKNIIRSYVDAGNDLPNAEDLHESLHYGHGMKSLKVAVAQINNAEMTITGTKITKIATTTQLNFMMI